MGIKLPWFRAHMSVKEGQEKNGQLVGTYSYNFESYFDSNAHSTPTPFDTSEGKQNKAKKSTLIDKKLPGNNKKKSAEKPKSKANSNSVKKIPGKESSQEEHKTNKNSNVPEKNITNTKKGVDKKSKRAIAKDLDQHFASTIAKGVQQNSGNAINKEKTSEKTNKEKLLQEAGSYQFKEERESRTCNESDSENQKHSQIDNENSILLRSNLSPHASNDGTQKSLRERRMPDSNLEQLTIIIPESSDEFDEEDIISPVLDEFHAYDEFDS